MSEETTEGEGPVLVPNPLSEEAPAAPDMGVMSEKNSGWRARLVQDIQSLKKFTEQSFAGQRIVLSDLNAKVVGQVRIHKSIIVYLRDIDTKIDTLRELLVKKELFTEDEFESAWDSNRGLRRKAETEAIEQDDVCWVNYKCNIEGETQELGEEDFPIRIGAGSVVFEKALIGQFPGVKGFKFTQAFKNAPKEFAQWEGKEAVFIIDVIRVKSTNAEKTAGKKDTPAPPVTGVVE